MHDMFWSSANLTGNQTLNMIALMSLEFWSSANLTGNQTVARPDGRGDVFWSSANLTGNQTESAALLRVTRVLEQCQSDW